jgi:hypothetical protein
MLLKVKILRYVNVLSDCISNRASQNTGTFSVNSNFAALNLENLAGQPDGEKRLRIELA